MSGSKDLIKDGWFGEKEVMWPGQRFSLKVEKVLLETRSEFQDILVFQSSTYGRVLVLDGVIQCTEKDECAYQEMAAHLALCSHPNPKRVLVIGGGDGGIAREVAKHQCVEQIHMCELDPGVVDACREHMPFMSGGLFDGKDPRFHLFYEDGSAFLTKPERRHFYDVIIVDSSDPVGPAETLFESQFFSRLRGALVPGSGVALTQGECMWLHGDLIAGVLDKNRRAGFPFAQYAWCSIPTYPCGTIGFCVMADHDCSAPRRALSPTTVDLRFYSSALHAAAFVLPQFIAKKLHAKTSSTTGDSSVSSANKKQKRK